MVLNVQVFVIVSVSQSISGRLKKSPRIQVILTFGILERFTMGCEALQIIFMRPKE